MISYIRRAEQETGNHCKVYMDLAGPKVRIESVLLRYGEARVMPGGADLFGIGTDFRLS